MADAEHIKLDDGSVIDVADAVARQKVGSAELQTTAKDCSGAINELKGTLTDMFTKVTKTIDCTSYLANPTAYTGAYVYTSDADFSGARYIIPLCARKSGSGYLVTVAVDSQAIRLCCIASQTDVVVDLLVVR